MALNTCKERAVVRMLVPCGPELCADERRRAHDVECQHCHHLFDGVHLSTRYQRTAVALLTLRAAACMQPDLPADAGVGGRQHTQRHDEHGHAVPGGKTRFSAFSELCENIGRLLGCYTAWFG